MPCCAVHDGHDPRRPVDAQSCPVTSSSRPESKHPPSSSPSPSSAMASDHRLYRPAQNRDEGFEARCSACTTRMACYISPRLSEGLDTKLPPGSYTPRRYKPFIPVASTFNAVLASSTTCLSLVWRLALRMSVHLVHFTSSPRVHRLAIVQHPMCLPHPSPICFLVIGMVILALLHPIELISISER